MQKPSKPIGLLSEISRKAVEEEAEETIESDGAPPKFDSSQTVLELRHKLKALTEQARVLKSEKTALQRELADRSAEVTTYPATPIVKIFNDFYEANKNQLQPKVSHTLNGPNLEVWARKFRNNEPEMQIFADAFKKYVRHISFTEFYQALRKVAKDLIRAAGKRQIVLVITGNYKKSATWAALLVWPMIRDYVRDVVSTVGKCGDVIYAFVDDASYSGGQISTELNPNKRANKSLPDIFILVGAISDVANNRLRSLSSSVQISQHSIRFRAFSSFLKIHARENLVDYDKIETLLTGKYRRIFQYDEEVSAIYFDHKLADSVSILNKLLATGIHVDSKLHNATYHSFIRGCAIGTYKIDGERAIKLSADVEAEQYDESSICPSSFYKTIVYVKGSAGRLLDEIVAERIPAAPNIFDLLVVDTFMTFN